MHVMRLPYDKGAFVESVADMSAFAHILGKYSSIIVRLSSPQLFKFCASPFCENDHPPSWTTVDLEHDNFLIHGCALT